MLSRMRLIIDYFLLWKAAKDALQNELKKSIDAGDGLKETLEKERRAKRVEGRWQGGLHRLMTSTVKDRHAQTAEELSKLKEENAQSVLAYESKLHTLNENMRSTVAEHHASELLAQQEVSTENARRQRLFDEQVALVKEGVNGLEEAHY